MSETVEETKDLVAVHNLQAEELVKSLELGGLPMPSVAIIKAQDGHEMYGDVTLVLPKDAIDPKVSKANKIYGGDGNDTFNISSSNIGIYGEAGDDNIKMNYKEDLYESIP